MKGTKIIFMDSEREYKELCQALEGDWINEGGGSNRRINPLQIRPTPIDEDSRIYKDEVFGMGDMSIYIFLEADFVKRDRRFREKRGQTSNFYTLVYASQYDEDGCRKEIIKQVMIA
ncbi:hypothetical protein LMP53_05095 [Clostridium botulinum]|nr:hypothetical protein [Clostridium botulinum]